MRKLFGLIGNPVQHSLSPLMHNDAFKTLQLPYYYHAFLVKEEHLKKAIDGMKVLGISGFNVTIPHKVEILQYLDEIDEEAKIIGAVNTVVLEDGKYKGYNTDGQGFYESLVELVGPTVTNKKVLLIGAGGAARAIYTTLVRRGIKRVDIANRSKERAEKLVHYCRKDANTNLYSLEEAHLLTGNYDILINTTSVGMSPHIDAVPLSLEYVKEQTVVADIIYTPLKTKWLQEAEKKGAIPLNGVPMFINQGALAFEKWTQIKPNRERMQKVVLEQLGGNTFVNR